VDHIVKKQIKVTEGISCESALKIILKKEILPVEKGSANQCLSFLSAGAREK